MSNSSAQVTTNDYLPTESEESQVRFSSDNTSVSRVIWSSQGKNNCELVSGRKNDSELYSSVLSVRMNTDPRWADQGTPVDNHSHQYCMFVNKTPVGSLGVTRLLEGEVYLNEFCPPQLFEDFHDCLVSAYRYRILSDFRRSSHLIPELQLSRHFVRETWREQIKMGARIDVINIEMTHVPLYQRMGYLRCEGYDYIDPILGTPSGIMYLPTDPDRSSIIQDFVRESGVSLSVGAVEASLYKQSVRVTKKIA